MEIRKYETQVNNEFLFNVINRSFPFPSGFSGKTINENTLKLSYYSFGTKGGIWKNFTIELIGDKIFQIKSRSSFSSMFLYIFSILIALSSILCLVLPLIDEQIDLFVLIFGVVGLFLSALALGAGILINKLIWKKIEKNLIRKCHCKKIK